LAEVLKIKTVGSLKRRETSRDYMLLNPGREYSSNKTFERSENENDRILKIYFISVNSKERHRWCLHLIVVVGFECSRDPETYAGGNVATGRATHAGQVKG
jgi:hypothetical protein